MKRQFVLCAASALTVLAVVLSGCGKKADDGDNNKAYIDTTDAYNFYEDYTGEALPADHLEYYIVCVNGDLYIKTDEESVDELPARFKKYGEVRRDDFYKIPTADLDACHVEVGSEVYRNIDDVESVYVKNKHDDGFWRYRVCSDADRKNLFKDKWKENNLLDK